MVVPTRTRPGREETKDIGARWQFWNNQIGVRFFFPSPAFPRGMAGFCFRNSMGSLYQTSKLPERSKAELATPFHTTLLQSTSKPSKLLLCANTSAHWEDVQPNTRFHPRMQFPAGCNCRVRASPHQISFLPFVAVPLQYIILNVVYLTLIRLCIFK